MTLDQKIQIWAVIGTWVAGIATVAATVVALHLARKSERVQLKIYAGIIDWYTGDGSLVEKFLCIEVINLGERPVTVNSVGWAVGKRKKRRYCLQEPSGPLTNQYPIELAHGKNAKFMVSFSTTPNWVEEFAKGFIKNLSDRFIKTLVVQVHTSVGQTIEARPALDLIKRLKNYVDRTNF